VSLEPTPHPNLRHLARCFFRVEEASRSKLFMLPMAIALFSASAFADAKVSLGWRATQREILVKYGSSFQQHDSKAAVNNSSSKAILRNSNRELARVELDADTKIGNNFSIGTRLMGGNFRLRILDSNEKYFGRDFLWEISSEWNKEIATNFHLESKIGMRARKMWFEVDKIPSFGNVGLTLGAKARWHGASLLTEATLAAVGLGKQTSWGKQVDANALRIRPELELQGNNFRPYFALEYFHSHTDFFSTNIVPGENAIMLDDFDLAAITGVRIFL
jgi:hypothetical protein